MIHLTDELQDERKNGFIRMKEMKESTGKKVVGTFCTYTPLELVEAAGAVAVSLCGSSEAGISDAEKVLPPSICPLIKSSYGLAATDKCPYFYFADMILAETTCDGKKKMYELMGEIKPTHVMQLPQGLSSDKAIDFWENEIYRAKDAIEKTLGATITTEKLREAIHLHNERRKAILSAYEIGKLKPMPLSVKDLLTVLDYTTYSFDTAEATERTNAVVREVYDRIEKEGNNDPEGPRILITGCPSSGVREKLIYAIEELGGKIVSYENCGGPRCQKDLVDETIDPYRALAEKYMRISCSVMSPNDDRLDFMKQMVEDYSVDGVIEVVLHGCHTFAIEAYKVQRFVKNELNLPYLCLNVNFSESDKGQLRTRISAFLEMISERKMD